MPDASTDLDTLSAQAAPKGAPPDIARMISQIQGMEAKGEKEQAEIDKQTDTAMAKDRAAMEKHASAEEDIMRTVEPWKQKLPEPDPIMKFGSLGSVFGLLASAFTHAPMVNGLNAAAAAINATRANDLAAYKDAYNTWKENTDLALKRQDMEHKEYQDAHQAMMDDFTVGQAKLRTAIAKYGSPYDHIQFEAGEYDKIFDRSLRQADIGLRLRDAMPELEAKGEIVQAQMALKNAKVAGDPEAIAKAQDKLTGALQSYADLRSAMTGFKPGSMSDPMQVDVQNPDGTTSKKMAIFDKENSIWVSADGKRQPIPNVVGATKLSSTGAANAMLSQEDLSSMADQYLAGDKSVLQGLGYGNQGATNRAALRSEIQKQAKDRGMSGADIAAKMLEFTELTSQARTLGTQAARLDVAGRSAYKAADLVLQTSPEVNRGDFVPLNNGEIGLRKGFSDPAAARYLASINTFINTYSRAISPTGQPRISDKNHARDLILAGYDKGAIKGVIDILKQEISNEQSSVGESRQDITNTARGQPVPPLGGGNKAEAHPQDDEAVQWARQHSDDPRAAQILRANGLQ